MVSEVENKPNEENISIEIDNETKNNNLVIDKQPSAEQGNEEDNQKLKKKNKTVYALPPIAPAYIPQNKKKTKHFKNATHKKNYHNSLNVPVQDKTSASEDDDYDFNRDTLRQPTETKVRDKKYRKIKGWTRSNVRVVRYYVSFLSYMSLVYHFYYFKLKKIEGYWSWAIIVFSALSSALSLFQYHEEKRGLELFVKVTISVFAIVITLMSSWVKKQNYVERISEIGKYSIKINRLLHFTWKYLANLFFTCANNCSNIFFYTNNTKRS